MSQRNMSLAFAGPTWVQRFQFPLHFACICSGAAAQQTCGFGHEPQKNLLSKINIPQHSPSVMAGQRRAVHPSRLPVHVPV
jgi:hypothetical protein